MSKTNTGRINKIKINGQVFTGWQVCNKLGLTYVSCSPYRVPIARLAAAQAVIKEKENN